MRVWFSVSPINVNTIRGYNLSRSLFLTNISSLPCRDYGIFSIVKMDANVLVDFRWVIIEGLSVVLPKPTGGLTTCCIGEYLFLKDFFHKLLSQSLFLISILLWHKIGINLINNLGGFKTAVDISQRVKKTTSWSKHSRTCKEEINRGNI